MRLCLRGFIRLLKCIYLSQLSLWCMLCEPVMGSATSSAKNANNLGKVLLNTLGKPFAAVPTIDNVTSTCKGHSEYFLQELSKLTPWAINMYDASTKIPSGLGTGNIQQMGNFDQCLSVIAKTNEETLFRGKQCKATFQFKKNEEMENNSTDLDMKDLFEATLKASDSEDWKSELSAPYVWALCVPSTCSATDVEAYFREALKPLNVEHRMEVMVKVRLEDCGVTNSTDISFTGSEIGMISLLAILSLILIGSTSYDLIVNKGDKRSEKTRKQAILMSFSLYTNGKNLISTSTGSDTMTCLHGMRFLSILWILLGHTYYMKSISPSINQINVKYYGRSVSRMVVMNGTVTTDTFFLLSGTLLCYIFMRGWQKKQSFNILTFYLHRYLRLTPPYAFLIFIYATLFYNLGSGPYWDDHVRVNRNYCIENWWTNLLYINNYINIDRMCMNQTWYLSVDMQLFWLSPLLLLPLAKWPRTGKGILCAAIFASIIIPLTITVALRLTAVMLYNKEQLMVSNVFKHIYLRTYTRAGPYFIGIALGYLLYTTKGKSITIPKALVVLGWFASIAFCLAVLLGAAVFFDDEHEYNALESGIYAGFHRSVWALGVAWMAFACIKGYGGPVDAFLSWKLFVPLSRLTYCAYLCHYIVLLYNSGTIRTPGYLSEYNIIHEFIGNAVLSFILAAAISLAVEMPVMNLDKIFLRPSNDDKYKKQKTAPVKSEEDSKPNDTYDNMGYKTEEKNQVAGIYVVSEHRQILRHNSSYSAVPVEIHN